MKKTDFDIRISAENVCASIGADEKSDLHEEIMEELREMLPAAYEKIRPTALLEFGSLEGYSVEKEGREIKEALFCLCTVGKEMVEWSTRLFAEGNCLGGMLVDAMSDDYLFQMDDVLQETAVAMCRGKGFGIAGRAEAPQDVPMSIQKRAYEVTGAAGEGIGITSGFMYDPVKTVCNIYLLDDDTERFRPEHDCSTCTNYSCRRRNLPTVNVRVVTKEKAVVIRARKSEPLLRSLQENGLFLPAVCGGRGTCGKCGVRFLNRAPEPSVEDRRFFEEEKLAEGWRLACCVYPKQSCTVELFESESGNFVVLAGDGDQPEKRADGEYGIAVDIGTTTLALQLVDLKTKETVDVFTDINRQRAYGADVISRIEASNSGKKEELKRSIREDILRGTAALTENGKIRVRRMVIAANTTMVHLLMGYSCETLGVFPFTPVNIRTIRTSYREMFGDMVSGQLSLQGGADMADFEIIVCPGISTYVGGDIVSGLSVLSFDRKDKPCVLIDLGTNGEMAVGCGERILSASTAAGPAFEGGNIVCGTGSIPGAICKVETDGEQVKVSTIGNAPARGICGTGVIDTVCELKKNGIIDETGLMEEPYFEDGFLLSEENGGIRFYQKDVREIQLAKSAVRAGLETLISKYGVTYEEIDRIYIAGGFGYQMDIHKAVDIGLLPAECEEKIEAVGNTSLRGAVQCLTEEDALERMESMAEKADEVPLSNDTEFQEYYMEYMYF